MASTKQEKVLVKPREVAQARNFAGFSGQPGASGSTSLGFSDSSHLDHYNSQAVRQKPTPAYLIPSAQLCPPSPPPEYEESPFRLATGTNMGIDIQARAAPADEDPVQPKEFTDDDGDNHHRNVSEVKSLKRKRRRIIAIIIITNVVILCAVLGGVLGSTAVKRASPSSTNGGTSSGQSSEGGHGDQAFASTSASSTPTTPYFLSTLSSSPFATPATVTATATAGQSGPGGGGGFSIGHAGIPEGTSGAAGNNP